MAFTNAFIEAIAQSRRCLGLNSAYVDKYGWHADVLAPLVSER